MIQRSMILLLVVATLPACNKPGPDLSDVATPKGDATRRIMSTVAEKKRDPALNTYAITPNPFRPDQTLTVSLTTNSPIDIFKVVGAIASSGLRMEGRLFDEDNKEVGEGGRLFISGFRAEASLYPNGPPPSGTPFTYTFSGVVQNPRIPLWGGQTLELTFLTAKTELDPTPNDYDPSSYTSTDPTPKGKVAYAVKCEGASPSHPEIRTNCLLTQK